MPDLEITIKAVEYCLSREYCLNCKAGEVTLSEALELLKAQRPRVMDYDELGGTINNAAVWLEFYGSKTLSIAILCDRSEITGAWQIFDYLSGKKHVMLRMSYGESWRCWTSRPTDAEREAAPWANMKGEAK